jgi:hypothetical protein
VRVQQSTARVHERRVSGRAAPTAISGFGTSWAALMGEPRTDLVACGLTSEMFHVKQPVGQTRTGMTSEVPSVSFRERRRPSVEGVQASMVARDDASRTSDEHVMIRAAKPASCPQGLGGKTRQLGTVFTPKDGGRLLSSAPIQRA